MRKENCLLCFLIIALSVLFSIYTILYYHIFIVFITIFLFSAVILTFIDKGRIVSSYNILLGKNKELEKLEYEYNVFLENIPIAVFKLSPDGKHIWANKQALDFLKETTASFKRGDFTKVISDEQRIHSNEIISKLKKKEPVMAYERSFKRSDGFQVHGRVYPVGIYNDSGQLSEIISFVFDLTKEKELLENSSNLNEKLNKKNEELEALVKDIFSFLAYLIDKKDSYTLTHSQNVAIYSKEMAILLNEDLNKILVDPEEVYLSSLVHDIGKIDIPSNILLKNDSLNEEEFDVMKEHAYKGYEILSKIRSLDKISRVVRYHHEKWNGHGYEGLKADSIPLESRIIAVADVFDALTTDRPYRKAWSFSKAYDFILTNSAQLFDPEVVKVFKKYYIEKLSRKSLVK